MHDFDFNFDQASLPISFPLLLSEPSARSLEPWREGVPRLSIELSREHMVMPLRDLEGGLAGTSQTGSLRWSFVHRNAGAGYRYLLKLGGWGGLVLERSMLSDIGCSLSKSMEDYGLIG